MTLITDADKNDARVLWEYNLLRHQPRPCSAAVVLGGCDIGVVTAAADLYRAGMFPVIVFTGSTSAATQQRFPGGEAFHFSTKARSLGIPEEAILLEPHATNTGQNIAFSRAVLEEAGAAAGPVTLICMPYMQRRAYATCLRQWPEVEIVCASQEFTFDEYAKAQESEKELIDMMMGDTHRVMEYPGRGFAIEQEVPEHVREAFSRLRKRGYDSWLLSG